MQIAGRKVYVLPPEMNIVLLTAHPLMHIVNTGIGLRQIIDWMMVLKGTRGNINTAKLYDQLNQLEQCKHQCRHFFAKVVEDNMPRKFVLS